MFWTENGERQNVEQRAITISPTPSPSPARGRKSVPGSETLNAVLD